MKKGGAKTNAGSGQGSGVSATTASTDAESGDDGGGADKELFALDAMYRRGLIPEEEYHRRRAEILSSEGKPDG